MVQVHQTFKSLNVADICSKNISIKTCIFHTFSFVSAVFIIIFSRYAGIFFSFFILLIIQISFLCVLGFSPYVQFFILFVLCFLFLFYLDDIAQFNFKVWFRHRCRFLLLHMIMFIFVLCPTFKINNYRRIEIRMLIYMINRINTHEFRYFCLLVHTLLIISACTKIKFN